ncbi:hypothetical protein PMAYCL1PPCAC_10456 [Pristionchus mayeri]|uniref:Uncharacterized protein n=1 Tax=Pristionchus mayeri TaxID=1317129 RepID=A0AAN4ZG84_9BILA|nr:hypothetical protein PMAYCL1PPCAC_10456 [Pristionchus mayeri]
MLTIGMSGTLLDICSILVGALLHQVERRFITLDKRSGCPRSGTPYRYNRILPTSCDSIVYCSPFSMHQYFELQPKSAPRCIVPLLYLHNFLISHCSFVEGRVARIDIKN